MTVIDSDHLKNPNRPATHPDHGTSKLLRKDLETKFQALFENAMKARHDIVINIAAEQKSNDLCYNDVASKFGVMNSYIIGKMVEFRVYHALKCYPKMYKCIIAKSEAAILAAVTNARCGSWTELVKKGYTDANGLRLKSYASLECDMRKLFAFVQGNVVGVNAYGAPTHGDAAYVEPRFEECLPPKRKRHKPNTPHHESVSTPITPETRTVPSGPLAALSTQGQYNALLAEIRQVNARVTDIASGKTRTTNCYASAAGVQMDEILSKRTRGIDFFSKEMVVAKTAGGFEATESKVAEYQNKSNHNNMYDKIMNKNMSNKEKVAAIQGL